MKVRRSREKVDFQPIEVTVTIESKEELEVLNEAYNYLSRDTVEKDCSEDAAEIVVSMLEDIYEATLD